MRRGRGAGAEDAGAVKAMITQAYRRPPYVRKFAAQGTTDDFVLPTKT